MAFFREAKKQVIEAVTFTELTDFLAEHGTVIDHKPWSFTYHHAIITKQNDGRFLVENQMVMDLTDMLVSEPRPDRNYNVYVLDGETFAKNYMLVPTDD